jgi:hypothetical protein
MNMLHPEGGDDTSLWNVTDVQGYIFNKLPPSISSLKKDKLVF